MPKSMSKITPCLWFDGNAEEAANFYASILPDSHVDAVHRAPSDYPSGKVGNVLMVEFTLMGQQFTGLNGGPLFKFNEAISFQIPVETQSEVDRLSDPSPPCRKPSSAAGSRIATASHGRLSRSSSCACSAAPIPPAPSARSKR